MVAEYLTHDDVEPIVEQIVNRELDVPRDGTKLEIQVGSHPCVVFRDRSRRGITIAHAKGKVLARLESPVCRWCAGDGLHPHLAPRMRQVLRETRSVNTAKGVTNSTEIIDGMLIAHVTPGTNIDMMGVGMSRPLRTWWDICERKSPDYLAVLPPYEKLCCPRCHGDGF